MTNEKLLAMWKQKLPNVEPTNQELTSFALGVEVGATAAGPSEAVKFTDQSTADPVEKARRYLSAMGSNHLHSSYFFDDGYPKQESATDALATLAVLEQLAAAPTTQPAPQQEASLTAGMNIAQRILHVGGRNNAAGYVEFGSIQAVEALVKQVLRDLPAPQPSPAAQGDAQDVANKGRCQHCLYRHDGVYGSWAAPCPYHDDDGNLRIDTARAAQEGK